MIDTLWPLGRSSEYVTLLEIAYTCFILIIMLRANNLRSKSSYNLDQYSGTATLPVKTTASSKEFGSRWNDLILCLFILNNYNFFITTLAVCRWTLAQAESSELLSKKQEDLHNTYYNNMVMYINNKQGDTESSMSSGLRSKKELFKSRESLYSTMLPVKVRLSQKHSVAGRLHNRGKRWQTTECFVGSVSLCLQQRDILKITSQLIDSGPTIKVATQWK